MYIVSHGHQLAGMLRQASHYHTDVSQAMSTVMSKNLRKFGSVITLENRLLYPNVLTPPTPAGSFFLRLMRNHPAPLGPCFQHGEVFRKEPCLLRCFDEDLASCLRKFLLARDYLGGILLTNRSRIDIEVKMRSRGMRHNRIPDGLEIRLSPIRRNLSVSRDVMSGDMAVNQ